MRQTRPYRIGNPPRALRKAKLDNIALVPASLLYQKGKYQTIANNLPGQGVLICHAKKTKPAEDRRGLIGQLNRSSQRIGRLCVAETRAQRSSNKEQLDKIDYAKQGTLFTRDALLREARKRGW